MKFLCDEMVWGLGRWLRAAGYDTAYALGGTIDRELLQQAMVEKRILISRDRHLLDHRAATGRVVLLGTEGIENWARELSAQLPIDWSYQPFSRCLLCNAPLVRGEAAAIVAPPPEMTSIPERLHYCPHCKKVYWEGSHVRRMRARLARFNRCAGRSAKSRRPPQ